MEPAASSLSAHESPRDPPRDIMRARLLFDPAFQVLSVDRTSWIDPYTGMLVPVPAHDGWQAAARDHLDITKAWENPGPPLTLEILDRQRWNQFVKEQIRVDERLRYFKADGSWLNPFTALWEDGIGLENGKITPGILKAIAERLRHCPQAAGGRMLAKAQLEALVKRPRAGAGLTGRESRRIAGAPLGERDSGQMRARKVIDHMLPKPPSLPGCAIAVHYQPMAVIGGDLFDFLPLSEQRWLIAVGDVSGHGTEAALLVASTLKSLRHVAPQVAAQQASASPAEALVAIVSALNDDIQNELQFEHFITLFAAVLDIPTRAITCVLAGHHQAVLGSARRTVANSLIGINGPALGMVLGAEFPGTLTPASVTLEPGDRLTIFTDGLFEQNNKAGEEYGINRAVASCLAHAGKPAPDLVEAVTVDARTFSGKAPGDDLTVVTIEAV